MLLAGGVASPTSGTGPPAHKPLFDDVTGVLSLGPKNDASIEYKPRPDLVKPGSKDVLPPPQESVVSAGNPSWPESPEQRRKRLHDEATAHQDDLTYDSPIAMNMETRK